MPASAAKCPTRRRQATRSSTAFTTQASGDNRVAALAAQAGAQELATTRQPFTTYVEARRGGEAGRGAGTREVVASGQLAPALARLILGGGDDGDAGQRTVGTAANQAGAGGHAPGIAGSERITIAPLATDGSDGPTDSAGGLVDGAYGQAGEASGLDAGAMLRRHDAYLTCAPRATYLLISGPTQTNVNDLIFVWQSGSESKSDAMRRRLCISWPHNLTPSIG